MKHLLNFFFGSSITCITYANIMLNSLQTEHVEIIKALISMLGGILSTISVYFINRYLQNRIKVKSTSNKEQNRNKTEINQE